MKKITQASIIFLGAVLAFLFSKFAIPDAPKISAYFKKDTVLHEVFSNDGPIHKIIFFSNCITGHYSAYNDLIGETSIQVISPFAKLGQVADALIQPNSNTRFYDLGRTNTELRDHIFYLDTLIRSRDPEAKHTIVYSNDFGGFNNLQTTDPASTLEAIATLERWQVQFPDLQPLTSEYIDLLIRQDSYADALALYGRNWRTAINRNTYTLPRYYPEGRANFVYDKGITSTILIRQHLLIDYLEAKFSIAQTIRNAGLWRFQVPALKQYYRENYLEYRNQKIQKLIEHAVHFHRKKVSARLTGPILLSQSKNFIDLQNNRAMFLWTKLLAEISFKANFRLVHYFPPNPSISKDVYERYYEPNYVRAVTHILDEKKHYVLDQTLEPLLTHADLIQKFSRGQSFYFGRDVNIVGNVKRAKSLIEGLKRLKILDTSVKAGDHFSLPDFDDAGEGFIPTEGFVDSNFKKMYDAWKANATRLLKFKEFKDEDFLNLFTSKIWNRMRHEEIESLDGLLHRNIVYKCEMPFPRCIGSQHSTVADRQHVDN